MSGRARRREAAWRMRRSDETTVRRLGAGVVPDDVLDAGVGVLVAQREDEAEAAVGGREREVARRDRGVEDDRDVAGVLDRQDVGQLIEEPPTRTAKPLPAQLRAEQPAACMTL